MILNNEYIFDHAACIDIPIPLPHYSIWQGKLIFMEYKVRLLDGTLSEAFSKIDGQSSIRALSVKHGINLDIFAKLEKERLIVIKKNKEVSKCVKASVCVLSPHYDDTIFSVGGIVIKHLNEIDWKIIDVFGEQDYTLYQLFYERNQNKNFALREERIAFKLLGLDSFENWNIKDALQRGTRKIKDVMQVTKSPDDIIREERDSYIRICQNMQNNPNLHKCDTIICPLAIGHHIDHILVRQACIQLFYGKKRIFFFEDLPYALSFDAQIVARQLHDSMGLRLSQIPVDITEHVSEKQYLARIYQSQIRLPQIKSMIEYGFRQGRYFENVWAANCFENMLL